MSKSIDNEASVIAEGWASTAKSVRITPRATEGGINPTLSKDRNVGLGNVNNIVQEPARDPRAIPVNNKNEVEELKDILVTMKIEDFHLACKISRNRGRTKHNDVELTIEQAEVHENEIIPEFNAFQVYIQFGNHLTNILCLPGLCHYTIASHIFDTYGIFSKDYNLFCDGKILDPDHVYVPKQYWINVILKLVGGMKEIGMNRKTRQVVKKLLSRDDELTESEEQKLREICEHHAEEVRDIMDEISCEQIESTQEEVNYDTSNVPKDSHRKLRKEKTATFSAKAKAQFAKKKYVGLNTSVSSEVERNSINKKEYESKVRMATTEVTVPDDSFDIVEFDYFLPHSDLTFYLFEKIIWVKGRIPKFAKRYINWDSSMPSTPVNRNNVEVRLGRTPECITYLRDLDNTQVVDFWTNVEGYYLSVQHDHSVEEISKSFKLVNRNRKRNLENFKDDSSFGLTIKNLFFIGTKMLSDKVNSTAELAMNRFNASQIKQRIQDFADSIDKRIKGNSLSQYTVEVLDDKGKEDLVVMPERNEIFEQVVPYPSTVTPFEPVVEFVDIPVMEDIATLQRRNRVERREDAGVKDLGLMTIFSAAPIFSIYFEEIVKCVPGGYKLIGNLDDWVHSSTHRIEWHARSMKYSFMDRIVKHKIYNAMHTDLRDQYVHKVSTGIPHMDIVIPEVEMLSSGTWLPSAKLPKLDKEQAEIYPFEHYDNVIAAMDTKSEQKMYPLLLPITNLTPIDNTLENYQAGVLLRLLVPKTVGAMKGEWNRIINELDVFAFKFTPDHLTWIKGLNSYQKSQCIRHLQAMMEGTKLDTRTKVFLKMGETLNKGYGRLIFNVNTKYLLLLGDFIAQFSKAMVESLFPHVPKFTISKDIAFHYVNSFDDAKLNEFVNCAMNSSSGKFVLVLGDDTAIIDRDNGVFIETDYSAFDSTQRKGQAMELFPALLKKMGFVQQMDDYNAMYNEKISWKHNKTGVDLEMPKGYDYPNSKMSGDPATSLTNSHVNIYATKFVLEGKTTYEKLGLVTKRKESKKFNISFLKGTWLWSVLGNKWYWVRLPNFLLKFKSFTEPKSIYGKTWMVERCEQQLLWSQWLGYGFLNSNWFYKALGLIIRELCPLASNVELSEEYRIYTTEKFYIDDLEFDTMMFERYNIDRIEMEDYLSFLKENVTSIPAIYRHTLTDKLMVDT